MALKGIDIAGWQDGIDLSATEYDFCIIKATQGTGYTWGKHSEWAHAVLDSGRLLGFYHYAGGENPSAEADHFVDEVREFVGSAVLVLDYESEQNGAYGNGGDGDWVAEFRQRVHDLTGVWPLLYCSASIIGWFGLEGSDLWVAQYADMDDTGWQDNPWNEGAYDCAIRQYTSCGHVGGYDAGLDLDKFYGDADAWRAYANAGGSAPAPSGGSGDIEAEVRGVLAGQYGNGDDRRAALGADYDAVQSEVNHRLTASADELARDVLAGRYGNGDDRRAALGDRYDEVQEAVNAICNGKSIDQLAQEVIEGDWGNNPERRERLTNAGYDADAVQARVNELL